MPGATIIAFPKRPPISIWIELVHHCDQQLEIKLHDLPDSEQARRSIAYALALAASELSPS